jgi:phage shock protein PspC (stress-responsive transcriptional regulator)/type II secretory pathway pseudopilin PulG
VRGLGIARADGWMGGVCAGIAARLRIDPIIVRGIAVVAALFGLPMLVIYAIAWALLPDISGRIHLREAFHRRFDPALVGIVILFLVGLVPVAPFVSAFLPFGYLLPSPDSLTPMGVVVALIGLALVGGLIVLIARSSRRASTPRADSANDPRTASADPVPNGATPQTPGLLTHAPGTAEAPLDSGDGASADSPHTVAEASAPVEPAPAPADASEAEIAQWRETHDAWRLQSDAWRRQQQDAERAARDEARREREAAAAAFAAEAAERRRLRRSSKPRTSFVFVLTALGAAIVTGAISALVALADTSTAPYALAIGILAAALVSALAMVVAGAVRRRSGSLTAVTIVLLVIGLMTAAASGPRSLVVGNLSLPTSTAPVSITQPFGATDIWVSALSESESVDAGTITIRKGTGPTYITVNPDTVLDLEARLGGGGVSYTRIDYDTGELLDEGVLYPHDGPNNTAQWDWFVRNTDTAGPQTRQRIVLDQAVGAVYVTIFDQEDNS